MTKTLLVVCSGNICRSPLAEAIFQTRLDRANLDFKVDSAGTGSWHTGDAPDGRAVVAARLKGYDITHVRARQIVPSDFEDADLILTMDRNLSASVEALRPSGNTTPVNVMTQYQPGAADTGISDPYYTGKFNAVIDVLEACADGFVAQLLKERQ